MLSSPPATQPSRLCFRFCRPILLRSTAATFVISVKFVTTATADCRLHSATPHGAENAVFKLSALSAAQRHPVARRPSLLPQSISAASILLLPTQCHLFPSLRCSIPFAPASAVAPARCLSLCGSATACSCLLHCNLRSDMPTTRLLFHKGRRPPSRVVYVWRDTDEQWSKHDGILHPTRMRAQRG